MSVRDRVRSAASVITGKMTDYAEWFRDEGEREEAAKMEEAREFASWASQTYHQKFLQWLDQRSSEKIGEVSDHMLLVRAVARADTFREIRDYLNNVDRDVKAALVEE